MREIEDRQPLWPYLLLSVLLHVLIIAFLLPRAFSVPKFTEKAIEVIPIEEIPELKRMRIADIAKPDIQQKPDKAKFLGMYDSAVKEEKGGLTPRPSRPQKSRIGPIVSKSRDTPPMTPAMKVQGEQPVAETGLFPVWRRLPVDRRVTTRVSWP